MAHALADRTVRIMLELLAINSPSGHEELARADLQARLAALGASVEIDPKGNLIGRIPATTGMEGELPVLLCCHMDTVPTAANVRPVLAEGVLRSDGTTALGADDKAGIAAILACLEHLREQDLPHGPLSILLTVEEEIGLEGIKAADPAWIGTVGRGYVLDASGPVGTAIISAPSKSDARVVFHRKAAPAGFPPENGFSAIMLAARAIDRMKLLRVDEHTTANIGTIKGGEVTNIVCDRCEVNLEVRSSTTERVNRHMAHINSLHQGGNDFGGSYEFFRSNSIPAMCCPWSRVNWRH
jgi:tripeptide aminopeptidase